MQTNFVSFGVWRSWETAASLRFASFSFPTSPFLPVTFLLYFLSIFFLGIKVLWCVLGSMCVSYVAFHGACVCNVNTHLVQLYRLFFLSHFNVFLSSSVCWLDLHGTTVCYTCLPARTKYCCIYLPPGSQSFENSDCQWTKTEGIYKVYSLERKKVLHKCIQSQVPAFLCYSFMKIVLTYIDTLLAYKKRQTKVKKIFPYFHSNFLPVCVACSMLLFFHNLDF